MSAGPREDRVMLQLTNGLTEDAIRDPCEVIGSLGR